MCSTIFPPWAACCSLVASFKAPSFSVLPPWLYLLSPSIQVWPSLGYGWWLCSHPYPPPPPRLPSLGVRAHYEGARCNICLMLASGKSLWVLTATMAGLILQGALHSKKWMQLSRTDKGGCCKSYWIPDQHALRITWLFLVISTHAR